MAVGERSAGTRRACTAAVGIFLCSKDASGLNKCRCSSASAACKVLLTVAEEGWANARARVTAVTEVQES